MRQGLLVVFAFLACLLYWWIYGMPLTGIDDAQIYFVYFRNFAEGLGFVYNYNGERVEGFTSLLWALIGSAFYSISPQHFPLLLLFFNILLCALTFLLFDRGIRIVWPTAGYYPLLIFIGYVVLVPGYIEWNTLSLMETGMWTMLLTASVVVLLQLQERVHHIYTLSLLVMLLIITRPESMLWGIFILLMFVLTQILRQNKYVVKPAAVLGITFGVTLLSLLAFRLLYFGYPFPNTFYAKVSGNVFQNAVQGGKYLFKVMEEYQFLCVFLMVSLVSLGLLAARVINGYKQDLVLSTAQRFQLILSATALLSFFIHFYTGGDHFGMARMFQPFIPVYFLMLFNIPFWRETLGINISSKYPWLLSGARLAAVLPIIFFSSDFTLPRMVKKESPLATEIYIAEKGISDAQHLNKLFSKVERPVVVGVSAAGGFAWAYNGPVVDLMGLNNIAMAHASQAKGDVKNHASFDLKTLLKIKPEVFHGYSHGKTVVAKFHTSIEDAFHPTTQEDFENRFVNDIFKGAFFDPAFNAVYKPAVIYHPQLPDLIYQAYFTNDFLSELKASGYRVEFL